jgi:hypothetical protein
MDKQVCPGGLELPCSGHGTCLTFKSGATCACWIGKPQMYSAIHATRWMSSASMYLTVLYADQDCCDVMVCLFVTPHVCTPVCVAPSSVSVWSGCTRRISCIYACGIACSYMMQGYACVRLLVCLRVQCTCPYSLGQLLHQQIQYIRGSRTMPLLNCDMSRLLIVLTVLLLTGFMWACRSCKHVCKYAVMRITTAP